MYCLLYTSEPPFQIWIKPLASKPANMKTAGWPYRKGFQRTRLRTAQDLAAGDQPYSAWKRSLGAVFDPFTYSSLLWLYYAGLPFAISKWIGFVLLYENWPFTQFVQLSYKILRVKLQHFCIFLQESLLDFSSNVGTRRIHQRINQNHPLNG